MISLHRTQTAKGDVSIALHKRDRTVGYFKDGHLQTLVDAQGRNLTPHVNAVVDLLAREATGRVLVLGHGGGAISSMLHRRGMDVVSVDCDPRAANLARLFFRAPPCLKVVVEDAAAYVDKAPPACFDAVVVDFQDSPVTPNAYLANDFWRGVDRLLRPAGMVLINVTCSLHQGVDWRDFRRALAAGGLDSVALGEVFETGNRLLVTSCAR
jgi:spermidine synthase